MATSKQHNHNTTWQRIINLTRTVIWDFGRERLFSDCIRFADFPTVVTLFCYFCICVLFERVVICSGMVVYHSPSRAPLYLSYFLPVICLSMCWRLWVFGQTDWEFLLILGEKEWKEKENYSPSRQIFWQQYSLASRVSHVQSTKWKNGKAKPLHVMWEGDKVTNTLR